MFKKTVQSVLSFCSKARLDKVINFLIAIYALLLFVESSVSEPWKSWLIWVEIKIVIVLCLEIALRVLFDGRSEVRSGWFWFDLVTTVLAFIPGYEAFRALRLARLLSSYAGPKRSLERLGVAIFAAKDELVIATVLLMVSSLIAHRAFAEVMPDRFAFVGDAVLSSFCLALFDEPWAVYSAAFSTNWLAALIHLGISMGTLLFIVPMIIWRVFQALEEPNEK